MPVRQIYTTQSLASLAASSTFLLTSSRVCRMFGLKLAGESMRARYLGGQHLGATVGLQETMVCKEVIERVCATVVPAEPHVEATPFLPLAARQGSLRPSVMLQDLVPLRIEADGRMLCRSDVTVSKPQSAEANTLRFQAIFYVSLPPGSLVQWHAALPLSIEVVELKIHETSGIPRPLAAGEPQKNPESNAPRLVIAWLRGDGDELAQRRCRGQKAMGWHRGEPHKFKQRRGVESHRARLSSEIERLRKKQHAVRAFGSRLSLRALAAHKARNEADRKLNAAQQKVAQLQEHDSSLSKSLLKLLKEAALVSSKTPLRC